TGEEFTTLLTLAGRREQTAAQAAPGAAAQDDFVRSGFVRHRLEALAATGSGDDVIAAGDKAPSYRRAKARARAGDENDPAAHVSPARRAYSRTSARRDAPAAAVHGVEEDDTGDGDSRACPEASSTSACPRPRLVPVPEQICSRSWCSCTSLLDETRIALSPRHASYSSWRRSHISPFSSRPLGVRSRIA